MAKTPKSEPDEIQYDLEYREGEDDAWYSVCVVVDAKAQTLTLKYVCSPVHEVSISAADFKTAVQVEELVARFRPISQQLQDYQCATLSIGTTVCAAHGIRDDDLRFYDAVIDDVNRQAHSFATGEEVCSCDFVLFWQHGRGRGTLTCANIASICILQPATQIDHRVSAFAKMAMEKIESSKSILAFDNFGSASKSNSRVSIEKNAELHQNRPLEMEISMKLKSLMWKSEDTGRIYNYDQWTSQDEDLGPKPCNIDGLATADGHYFIMISNLEKDLTPSSIKNFIYKQTTIQPQAFVFPTLLSEPFARGAIMVDTQKKFQIIYEFLDNANHLVVSSRGRPWVVEDKELAGHLEELYGTLCLWPWLLNGREHKKLRLYAFYNGFAVMVLWSELLYVAFDSTRQEDEIRFERTDKELQVVVSGSESYNRVKQWRDLFVEFIHHESQLCKKLVLEEEKILLSCQPA